MKKEGLFGSVTITDAPDEYRYVWTECPECVTLRARLSLADKVVEAARVIAKYYVPEWGTAVFAEEYTHPVRDLIAALLAYDAQKEGKDVT